MRSIAKFSTLRVHFANSERRSESDKTHNRSLQLASTSPGHVDCEQISKRNNKRASRTMCLSDMKSETLSQPERLQVRLRDSLRLIVRFALRLTLRNAHRASWPRPLDAHVILIEKLLISPSIRDLCLFSINFLFERASCTLSKSSWKCAN